jgi:hypothetical protein
MFVNPPRLPGAYPQRAHDCEMAIERGFLREVVETSAPFLDLDAILTAIAADATKAGWSEEELTEAVKTLAQRHSLDRSEKRQA